MRAFASPLCIIALAVVLLTYLSLSMAAKASRTAVKESWPSQLKEKRKGEYTRDSSSITSTADFMTRPFGFLDRNGGLKSPGYQYGPTVVLYFNQAKARPEYVALFCSPGGNGAWDYIRMTTSDDFMHWSDASVALQPQTIYEKESVCDPSIILFKGVWFLYHTCINTDHPPDGYTNNRICVTMADAVRGTEFPSADQLSFHSPTNNVVVQDLNCTKDSKKAYCVGQPSAVVSPDGSQVLLYFTRATEKSRLGPNPGNVYVASSTDGVHFSWNAESEPPVYPQRDVDVKYDRRSKTFLMVEGDVGSNVLTYATSTDGKKFTSFSPSLRNVTTNPALPKGGTNNNPGLVGRPDGSFSGMTAVVYGSSTSPPAWGHWKLYASTGVLSPQLSDCTKCASNSCDFACMETLKEPAVGFCAAPYSRKQKDCCSCEKVAPAPEENCMQCAPDGCVAACRVGGHRTGICGHPGSRDKNKCCVCFA